MRIKKTTKEEFIESEKKRSVTGKYEDDGSGWEEITVSNVRKIDVSIGEKEQA